MSAFLTALAARRAAALHALAQRPTADYPGETQPSGDLPTDPEQAARHLNARYDATEEPTR